MTCDQQLVLIYEQLSIIKKHLLLKEENAH